MKDYQIKTWRFMLKHATVGVLLLHCYCNVQLSFFRQYLNDLRKERRHASMSSRK